MQRSKLRKTGRSLICVLICLMMSTSLLTVVLADGEGSLVTEQPALVITGQGLPGGARGSAENVSYEKAYTLDELRALDDFVVERLYSSINSFATKMFYRGQGIDLEAFLDMSGYTEKGRINMVASDGYASAFNMDVERYYYPNLGDSDESDAELVGAMLAWRNVDNRDEPPIPPEQFPTSNEDADGQSLRLLAGQANVEDVNSNLYARNVNKLIVGGAVEGVDLTVLGEEYTRADILLMPRAEHTHTSGTTLRGVPVADLLKDVSDGTEIKFQTVDNWERISDYTMTKAELAGKNAILAYEVKDGDDWTAYYRQLDEGVGLFRLWIDDISGAHAVNEVYFFEAGDAPQYSQPEIIAALNAGLLPDSVALAGWQNDTSRLAAAEAMVLLIEKATGKSIDEIAEENDWDLTTGGFDDTDSQAVTFLRYAEITVGLGDNLFGVDSTFTRAAAVTMIGRSAEIFLGVEMQGENPFTDVPDWAAIYIGYAAESGITQGVSAELFGSDNNLQNQQTALFMIRAFNAWN